MSWPQAFHDVGIVFAIAIGSVGIVWMWGKLLPRDDEGDE